MTSINELNDTIKALRYIRSAYEINKYNIDVVFNYGLILLKTDDVYRAEEKFLEVTKLDENFKNVKLALSECKVRQNKPNEAIEILDNLSDEEKNEKNYLMIRALALKEILKNNLNDVTINEINAICDKIQKDYGDYAMAEELRQLN